MDDVSQGRPNHRPGPYYDTRNSLLSITGGTGSYRRARGEMTLLSRNRGTQYDFIFNLS